MTSDRPSLAEERIELEPVTCWPLIYSAVAFVSLGSVSVLGVWVWNVLSPRTDPIRPRVEPVAVVVAEKPTAIEKEEHFVAFQPERKVVAKTQVVKDGWHWPHMLQPIPRYDAPGRTLEQHVPGNEVIGTAKPLRTKHYPMASTFTERASMTAEVLREDVWKLAKELDLEKEKGEAKKLLTDSTAAMKERAAGKKGAPKLTSTLHDYLAKRDDLRGLPLVGEDECQSSAEATKTLANISTPVRRLTSTRRPTPPPSRSISPSVPESDPHVGWLYTRRSDLLRMPQVARPLVQMFQVESEPARQELINTLTLVKDKEASLTLAQRAVFDLSPAIRKAAITALKERPLDEARPALLAGLAYPWTPAADHAAFALLELDDAKAIPELESMLEEADPCKPFDEDEKWYVREVVRVNHLGNCLLCHPPTVDSKDVVTGPIPTPGKPLGL